MIKVLSYEINHDQIGCTYRKSSIALDDIWLVTQPNHLVYVCKTFLEASQKMDEAIEKLRKEKEK